MPKATDTARMSSVIPKLGVDRLAGALERRLPTAWWDAIFQFGIQTRLILSWITVLLVVALMAAFIAFALFMALFSGFPDAPGLDAATLQQNLAFIALLMQGVILVMLLNMNLWGAERDDRTFELLVIRMKSIDELIWLKLRVTMIWTIALYSPFFAAYGWFLEIPIGRLSLYFIFCMTSVFLVAVFTCVVSTFVKNGLATAVITFIVWFIAFAFTNGLMLLKYGIYFSLFLNPIDPSIQDRTLFQLVRDLTLNRVFVVATTAACYVWLRRRLAETEGWAS